MRCYTIQALDGADDDGGTLYVLYDETGEPLHATSWPHPLERIAADAGFSVRRSRYVDLLEPDCDLLPIPHKKLKRLQ